MSGSVGDCSGTALAVSEGFAQFCTKKGGAKSSLVTKIHITHFCAKRKRLKRPE